MARPKKNNATTSSNLKTFYLVLAVVALAGVGSLAYSILGDRATGAATEMVELDVESAEALMEKARGVEMGNPDAPVRVVEFGDFQCPGCRQFATGVKSMLKAEYVDTDKVHFVFYDFPLPSIHQHAFLAARATRCAEEQGKYWAYHDHVYGQQNDWAFEEAAVDKFVEYAEQLGLDTAAFESCLKSDRHADVVTANRVLGEQIGVNATPTVIVNGKRVQNPMDYSEIKRVIEEELGG